MRCPRCEGEIVGVHITAEPWIVDLDATLANGGLVVRRRNPDQHGVVFHSGGRRCQVADARAILEAIDLDPANAAGVRVVDRE